MRPSRDFRVIFKLCLTLVSALPLTILAADAPFPESMVTLRAQPAVFFVRAIADIELQVPESVDVNVDAVKRDLSRVQNAGHGQATVSDGNWDLIFQNPERYLIASGKLRTESRAEDIGWSGSAFAISREGILLTNAHVAGGSTSEPVTEEYFSTLDGTIQNDLKKLASTLGKATTTEERVNKAWASMYAFYAPRCRITSKFKSAQIVLDYKVDPQKSFAALKSEGMDAWFGSMKREAITVPAKVLAIGQSLPGKDVAVLKVTFEPEEQARLLQRNQQQPLPGLEKMLADLQNDRMVCLALGDVKDVLPQEKVYSLGFPGVGFNEQFMDPESRFKVSSKSGQISQTKRMLSDGGWDIFEMTAPTNHGDSGGPVLNVSGRVIGLNVGKISFTNETNLVKLAIPINIAQEMLKKLDIKPDPGPLSAHWEQGLRRFAEGKYQESLQEIQTAIKIQKGTSLHGNREASWYLRDMAGRCLQKLGKIP